MPPKIPPGTRYAPREDTGTPFWAHGSQPAPEASPAAPGPLPGAAPEAVSEVVAEQPDTHDAAFLTRWYHGQAYQALIAAALAIAAEDWPIAALRLASAAAQAALANSHARRVGQES